MSSKSKEYEQQNWLQYLMPKAKDVAEKHPSYLFKLQFYFRLAH